MCLKRSCPNGIYNVLPKFFPAQYWKISRLQKTEAEREREKKGEKWRWKESHFARTTTDEDVNTNWRSLTADQVLRKNFSHRNTLSERSHAGPHKLPAERTQQRWGDRIISATDTHDTPAHNGAKQMNHSFLLMRTFSRSARRSPVARVCEAVEHFKFAARLFALSMFDTYR